MSSSRGTCREGTGRSPGPRARGRRGASPPWPACPGPGTRSATGPAGAWGQTLVCPARRGGGGRLGRALEDAGVLGAPAEYFRRGAEPFWRGRWGAADEDAFLRAVQDKPVTGNGVWASKMMQNYLEDAVARLRAWPRLGLAPDGTGRAVLEAAFPGAALRLAAPPGQGAAGDLLVADGRDWRVPAPRTPPPVPPRPPSP